MVVLFRLLLQNDVHFFEDPVFHVVALVVFVLLLNGDTDLVILSAFSWIFSITLKDNPCPKKKITKKKISINCLENLIDFSLPKI